MKNTTKRIEEVLEKQGDKIIVIGGDFNARIGREAKLVREGKKTEGVLKG